VVSKALRKVMGRKRYLWHKCLTEKANDKLASAYKNAEKQCKQLLHQCKIRQELCCVHTNNIGSFYKFVNSRLSNTSGVGAPRDSCENNIMNDEDKDKLLK
jgi:hypothetical protein